jgi:hypothetical protein
LVYGHRRIEMYSIKRITKRFFSIFANTNRTVALISLLVELLGGIVLLEIIKNLVMEFSIQLQTNNNLFTIIETNSAKIIGCFIMLFVLLKTLGKDIYEVIWNSSNYRLPIQMENQGMVYFLRGLKETYIRNLHEVGRVDPPFVRINIMMAPKPKSGKEEYIKIVYAADIEEYSENEINQLWKKGEGKCGHAWENKRQEVYAADIRSEETLKEEMGEKPPEIVKLKSVLSTPIIIKEKVVAILNIDSELGGSETLIHTHGVRGIFSNASHEITPYVLHLALLQDQ